MDKWSIYNNYFSGFTVIEFLVVLGIMTVILTIGVASYNNFNEKKVLEEAAQDIKTNLRYTQTKALAGEKDCDLCGGADCDIPLDGWYIEFFPSASPIKIEIYGQCGSTEFPTPRKVVEFDKLDSLSLSSVPNPLQFRPLRQGTNLSTSGQISISAYGRPATIEVTTSGEIK